MSQNMNITNVEIKFLLDNTKTLTTTNELNQMIKTLFGITKTPSKTGACYYDTEDLDFNDEGWINRLRHKNGDTILEASFKKRYAIVGEDITSALNQANKDTFDITDTNYAAEIDWNFSKMTLSVGLDKEVATKLAGTELPSKKDAIKIVSEQMPGKLVDWEKEDWGHDKIEDAKKYGPIVYTKYKGVFQSKEVKLEIWPMKNATNTGIEYIVEISMDIPTVAEARIIRSNLKALLESKGVLVATDSLKTQLMLERY